MSSELKQKIADDIWKSGFGSEMRVLMALQKAGWSATGLAYYFDLDSSTTRESDIKAHSVMAESRDNERTIDFQAFQGLSIEVKKSEKPWIVFKEIPRNLMGYGEGSNGLIFSDGLTKSERPRIRYRLQEFSIINQLGWFGNGVHESFKKPDQPSRWYSFFVSVCKAAEQQLRENSWDMIQNDPPDHFPYVWFVRPMIVLDGQLFSAGLNPAGELLIDEQKYCSVKFEFTSPNYTRSDYLVDIVTIDGLSDYLELCKARLTEVASILREISRSRG